VSPRADAFIEELRARAAARGWRLAVVTDGSFRMHGPGGYNLSLIDVVNLLDAKDG
jgi:hypothetical protein